MRGIISFALVVFLAVSIVYLYSSYINYMRNDNYYLAEQTFYLQKFYDTKIKIKRGIQNILAYPVPSQDPLTAIETVAHLLEDYERSVESNQEYQIDVWCGYVDFPTLELMLDMLKTGVITKPPYIFDPSTKVEIDTKFGKVEVHACDAVLVYDHSSKKVGIGRGYSSILQTDVSAMKPVIGISIRDETHKIYDVDYVEVV